ncbi:MAG: hypothetical protein GY804_11550 [Alphaproteobacteria bacterium]|nr:hypothetical protein [Alphaproteobacteria bacterium]
MTGTKQLKSLPQVQQEVKVDAIHKFTNNIHFYASNDASNLIAKFGYVIMLAPHFYSIKVDRRFNFDEVLNVLENYDDYDMLEEE